MKCRYIILIGGRLEGSLDHTPWRLGARLRAANMVCKLESASAKVFVSTDTPTLRIRNDGLIIGQLFTRDGEPIVQPLRSPGTANQLISHLLQNAWGEYVAVSSGSEDSKEMTLLRDPSGAVPCFHSLGKGEGFITSDIGLATELGIYRRQVDWQVVAHYLRFPYLRTARTALKHVSELLPGNVLVFRMTQVSTLSAWSPWRFVAPGIRHQDPRAAASDVRTTVSRVIATLAAMDDRIIVELSGGLDSSIVAACLRGASQTTYCTLVMPVSGTDERAYARLVTDDLGRELVPLHVGFDHVRFEFPVSPSSVAPTLGILQNAVNEVWEAAGDRYGVDSFFSGGGGDTIFGYLKTAAPAADAFIERGAMAGIAAIRDLATLHQCTVWKAGRLTFKKLSRSSRRTWKRDDTFLNPACLATAPDHHPWMNAPTDALPGDREKIYDLIGTQLFRDATPRGHGRSMHFPLLTQPVMEACLKVPTWMCISNGRNRAIARDAFADRLPRGILDRRSKGSYTGYMAAVYARNKSQMRQFLEEGQLSAQGLLDLSALAEFFASELAPRDLSFLRIFDLCAAENWTRQQLQFPS